jgi:chemosensory pili system protein ChpA (sensor histidine kinase/response regulator)
MRLDDLLRVMREEFALAADGIDERLMAWLTAGCAGAADDPAAAAPAPHASAAEAAAGAIGAELERLASTARIIALNGLADALDHVRASVAALMLFDEETLGLGLSWLAGWRAPFEACFEAPGAAGPADELLAWLGCGPMAPAADALAGLRAALVSAPVLPGSAGGEESLVRLPEATDADVSLAVPEDIDRDLFETFLADAPRQMERLGDMVRTLARGTLDEAALHEAQRVAHTFKGSGNIIGIRGVGRLAHRIEDLIEFAAAQPGRRLPAPMANDLEQATAALDQMIYALRGEEAPPPDARQHLQRLLDWINAIREGTWAEKAGRANEAEGARGAGPSIGAGGERGAAVAAGSFGASAAAISAAAISAEATSAAAPGATSGAASGPGAATGASEAEPELRVAVSRLERLVRRAGQGLVQGSRVNEHLRALEERLHSLQAHSRNLQARVAELQAALDRQRVALRGKAGGEEGAPGAQGDAGAAGTTGTAADFDPLEMDRYNQLHTLARFVAELADDEIELHRSAREEATRAQATLRDHTQALKDQHRELLAARLLPFRHIASRLKRTVSQTAAVLGRQAQLVIEGDGVQLDSDVLERLTEPLLHLLRNAVDHGLEAPGERRRSGKAELGTVRLRCKREGSSVRIECSDDGRGIDLEAVHARALALGLVELGRACSAAELARLILLPGFSTRDEVTEVSGRGVGMDVVAERVRSMKGQVEIATHARAGTTITLRVPATTGSLHALIVEAGGHALALPTESVVRAVPAGEGQWLAGADGAPRLQLNGREFKAAPLADWVGWPGDPTPLAERPVVLVRTGLGAAAGGEGAAAGALARDGAGGQGGPGGEADAGDGVMALGVERVVDARELILQDLGLLLRRARGVVGGAVRPDGRALFVVDPAELARGALQRELGQAAAAELQRRARAQRRRVLVVEDAISVRKAVAQMLGDAGYDTLLARDGFDALQQLGRERVDLVITDLEMPNLNGLDFVRHLRRGEAPARWAVLPVVMITSRATDKHRQAALDAGVSRYMTKPYTDAELLAQVRGLISG